jgi:hypothetical protein
MESDTNDSDEVTSSYSSESSEEVRLEFEYFGRLPTEIRLKIWTQVCLEPRVIDLWAVPTIQERNSIDNAFYYATHSRVPSILSVSKEARKVGLEYYTLEFESNFKEIIGTSRWHRYRCMGKPDCDCRHSCCTKITTTSEPHIYVNLNCDIICPMPLEAPLGYGGRNRLNTSESRPMMLDDFVREDEAKIYRIAFDAIDADFEGAHFEIKIGSQSLWGFFLASRRHRLAKIIVFRTPEKPITNRWGERLGQIFDPEDPITLELLNPEHDTAEEKEKSAREVEFQRALEEIKKYYGPDDKLPIIEHKVLKVRNIYRSVVRTV